MREQLIQELMLVSEEEKKLGIYGTENSVSLNFNSKEVKK